MRWEGTFEPSSLDIARTQRNASALRAGPGDPALAQRVGDIQGRNPWMSPDTVLSLAKGYASPAAIDMVGEMSGVNAAIEQGNQSELLMKGLGFVGGIIKKTMNVAGYGVHFLSRGLGHIPGALGAVTYVGDQAYTGLQLMKPVSKYGTAALDIIPETLQNIGSIVMTQGEKSPQGFWNSTSLATLLANPEDSGEGFFISDDMRQEQARKAREFRGTINGSAFTIGRGMANIVSTPGSQFYTNVSGLIDAMVLLAIPDPTRLLTKPIRALSTFKGVVPILAKGERLHVAALGSEGMQFGTIAKRVDALDNAMDGIRKAVKDENPAALLAAEAGLHKSLTGGGVDMQKFIKFMREKPAAIKLSERLVEEKNAGTIFNDIFKGQLTTDLAKDLAEATSRDQVIAILTHGYEFGATSLNRNISAYTPSLVRRFAGAEGLRRTRGFAEVPDSVVAVTGNDIDNMKAIKTMINSLRGAGVGREDIAKWSDTAVRNFTTRSTSGDMKGAFDSYQDLVKLSLKANKIDNVIIGEVLKGNKNSMDDLRSYFKDRNGVNTDNGFLGHLMEQTRDFLPMDSHSAMLDAAVKSAGGHGFDLAFNSPMQYADMLNRVRILPDPRVLRRLTRNSTMTSFMQKYMNKLPVGGVNEFYSPFSKQVEQSVSLRKVAVFSKKGKRTLATISDEPQYNKLLKELDELKAKHPAGTVPQAAADEMDLIKAQMENLVGEQPRRVITGEQRMAIQAIEFVQNGLWKPFTLMTGGYMMRNMIDAQVRMSFGGLTSVARHPLEYMSLVMGRRLPSIDPRKGFRHDTFLRDILGDGIVGGGSTVDDVAAINKLTDDLREGLTNGMRSRGMDSQDVGSHLFKTGRFSDVSRSMPKNGIGLHADGIIQQGGKIHNDDLQRKAVIGLFRGDSEEKVIDGIVESIHANPDIYKQLKGMYHRGIEFIDPQTGATNRFPSINFDDLTRKQENIVLAAHAEKIVLAGVRQHSGNIPEMQFMMSFNHTPLIDSATGQMVTRVVGQADIRPSQGAKFTKEFDAVEGRVVLIDKDQHAIIIKTQTDINNVSTFTVVPVEDPAKFGFAFGNYKTGDKQGSRHAQGIIKKIPLWDDAAQKGLPRSVSREITGSMGQDQGPLNNFHAAMDKTTNWFFSRLNEKEIRVLERSPVFRQFYYKTVGENIGKLSAVEAKTVLENLSEGAAAASAKSAGEYIGNPGVVARLEKIASGTKPGGTLTAAELDDFAKYKGLADMQNLLFDAANTNNIKDIMRIIVPFGNAWSEVIGRYLNFAATDGAHLWRSSSRVYNGLERADPDNDGRGFFYDDPQSGQLMFMFPMSGLLSKIFTGGDYEMPLTAPVARLSQGINVYPGIGPMAQIAATKLIRDVPKFDAIVDMLLPYGRSQGVMKSINPIPMWAQKLGEAFSADTDNLTTRYFNTYMETIKAESATGDYDLSQVSEIDRLKEVSKEKARMLMFLRVASQFFGPTAGSGAFKVPTDQGDQFVRELSKEFGRLQAEDYDSAVEKFLKLYGDDAALYVSTKSKALEKGLEATTEFGDWERVNRDLQADYPRVGNYLAPTDEGFDFDTQGRQLRHGQRKLLSASEMISEAQLRIGSARYRAAKEIYGPYPSPQQTEVLKAYRVDLNDTYPGFPVVAEFLTNAATNDIFELIELVKDSRVQGDPAVSSIKKYLALRGDPKGLGSKKNVGRRRRLFAAGQNLSLQDPAFARIWKRLLSKEVED